MSRKLMAAAALSLAMIPGKILATATAAPTATFAVPNLVGYSNSSLPGGSNFWFPSISIPTGIKGHVAQHITLSGDGGTCPPKPPLSQYCEQIMLTTDGGRSYKVVKKIGHGTSGNFNGKNSEYRTDATVHTSVAGKLLLDKRVIVCTP